MRSGLYCDRQCMNALKNFKATLNRQRRSRSEARPIRFGSPFREQKWPIINVLANHLFSQTDRQ